ncbi:MAG: response regulator [Planctomycetota bacterium]
MTTLRILIVDDEQGMRMGVRRALRSFTVDSPDGESDVIEFDLDEAGTGEEALEKISARKPDILLLDMKLPGIDGLDVLEEIRRRSIDLSTIMITAYASIQTAVKATKRGAFDFLPKPFTPDELKTTLRRVAQHLVLAARARQLADERHKVRFNFISVLAHELKAPINAIEGYLQILSDFGDPKTIDPDAFKKMIDRSTLRIQFMRKMILDLLDLTRIESGQKKRLVEPIDIVPIAAGAIDAVKAAATERGIALDLDAPDRLVLPADASEIEIIFNNLVSNAVKYNRDNGRVDVILSRHGDEVLIVVRDTGIGMTSDEAGRLFGEFVRIKNEKTRLVSGTGLGLSIVKKIAALYNGGVSVESAPDKGSAFRVKLTDTTAHDAGDSQTTSEPLERNSVSGRLSSIGIVSDLQRPGGSDQAIVGE